ncbi:chorion class A protein Ld19-like [Melitaea cinxia]|uniref:chorion class A protein Ld19-like n=1 Tax=Melitaea cinxia TaxID=113334 RepID=UPI001E2716E5|nr:chorion class A protein Ld19-like [Melitaea cinxia]
MSTFAVLLFCAQACLVQNVYSHCHRSPIAPIAASACGSEGRLTSSTSLGYGGIAAPLSLASPLGASSAAAYGGTGVGEIAVGGEMGVIGTTLVAGQVPVLGAVEFGGLLPATGGVSISGSCGCGCNGAYAF